VNKKEPVIRTESMTCTLCRQPQLHVSGEMHVARFWTCSCSLSTTCTIYLRFGCS